MFADKLKELRKAKGMTQTELASEIGISNASLSSYEVGARKPKDTKQWRKIADYFGVTVDYLMNEQDDGRNGSSNSGLIEIPIVGNVAAGGGCLADNTFIGSEYIPKSWVNPDEDYVLLKVKGESMYPKFEDDDLLLVKVQSSVDSGAYAIALIDDEDGVVKRVIYNQDKIELISVNPMYPPRIFQGEDMKRVRIFGVVKKGIRDI